LAVKSVFSPTKQAIKTPNQQVMVRLRNVTKVYGNNSVSLSGVNLDLMRGGFLFITGVSGAGKSTLLKLLYGEEKVNQGEVIVDGCNVSQLQGNHLSLFRRRIGIVFQDFKLIPRRTVAENVAFVLQSQGVSRTDIQKRLPATLKLVGLSHKSNCFPDQLSGGEQQRVSLARAIVHTPPLILADEPTGNLDPDHALQVLKVLQKLHSYGATVIVSTHDERLVLMSDYPVAQLRNGRLYHVRGN
jgi:cell division transport system ATP-binding protein